MTIASKSDNPFFYSRCAFKTHNRICHYHIYAFRVIRFRTSENFNQILQGIDVHETKTTLQSGIEGGGGNKRGGWKKVSK